MDVVRDFNRAVSCDTVKQDVFFMCNFTSTFASRRDKPRYFHGKIKDASLDNGDLEKRWKLYIVIVPKCAGETRLILIINLSFSHEAR